MRRELEYLSPIPNPTSITIPARHIAIMRYWPSTLRVAPGRLYQPTLDTMTRCVQFGDELALLSPGDSFLPEDRHVGWSNVLRQSIYRRAAYTNSNGVLTESVVGQYHLDHAYEWSEEWVTEQFQPTGKPPHPDRIIALTSPFPIEPHHIEIQRGTYLITQHGPGGEPEIYPERWRDVQRDTCTRDVPRNVRAVLLEPGDDVIVYFKSTRLEFGDDSSPLDETRPDAPTRMAFTRSECIRNSISRQDYPHGVSRRLIAEVPDRVPEQLSALNPTIKNP